MFWLGAGVWGLLLDTPILMIIKAVCDRVDDLKAASELLGGAGYRVELGLRYWLGFSPGVARFIALLGGLGGWLNSPTAQTTPVESPRPACVAQRRSRGKERRP